MSAALWTSAVPAVSLAAWLWLLLCQGMSWRTDVRLPPARRPASWPSVCVVVPARDEAAVLPASLPSLLAQDYPGPAEVFLVDDGSSDGTGELARELARHQDGLRLTVASPGEPPPGWTGKLWAVRHGIVLARARAPEYLLLTDADIAHAPDSLRRLVAAADAGGFDAVSQMARLRVSSLWERLVVPAFVYFFAQLYPFRRVAKEGARTAAAAGGCVLLRTEAAERARIPDSIRQAVIDDVALARAVKRGGGRIWLGLADGVDSVRPYPRLRDLWRMVSRSAYASCATGRWCWSRRSPDWRWCTWCAGGRRRRRGRRERGRRGARRTGLAGDVGHVPADAPLLRAAGVARPRAAVHRAAVPADDGRLRGAAPPGTRGGVEGPHLRPPRRRARGGLNAPGNPSDARDRLRRPGRLRSGSLPAGVQFMPHP